MEAEIASLKSKLEMERTERATDAAELKRIKHELSVAHSILSDQQRTLFQSRLPKSLTRSA